MANSGDSLSVPVPKVGLQSQRRSLKWVDPKFQRRYTILLLSLVLLISGVLIGTFWFHAEQVLTTLANAGVAKDHALYQLIENQMGSLLLSVSIVTGLFCLVVFIIANFLSHRIVGPLFAIKRSLNALGRGNFREARVKLRKEDEFEDVAEMINHTVDQLEKRE